jgi:membrane fusion protein, multidrug efflux system
MNTTTTAGMESEVRNPQSASAGPVAVSGPVHCNGLTGSGGTEISTLSQGSRTETQQLGVGPFGEAKGTPRGMPPSQASIPGRAPGAGQYAPASRGWNPRFGTIRHRMYVLAGLGLLALIGCGASLYWQHARTWVKTDNAYVTAHIHTVSTRVSGTVKELLVEENQSVEAGSVLARLDSIDFENARQQAAARLAHARAQVEQAKAQIAQARAQVEIQQARTVKAKQDLARAELLFGGTAGAISRQEFDLSTSEYDAAKAALHGAESAEESVKALTVAAKAQEQVAEANLEETELQLSYTELRAPAAGRIGKKNLETGNRVQPGQALLALVQPEVWVTANFKETQLARMKPGQFARIRLDAFPGWEFAGKLESLSPASGAQFALLPPENATGNFTRIVQRVPVKVVFTGQNLGDCAGRIAPGMSAIVEINVRE